MMYTIRVSDGVDKVIAKWKKSNPNLFKKYKKIYKEVCFYGFLQRYKLSTSLTNETRTVYSLPRF